LPLAQVLGSAQTVINTATDIANAAFSGAPAASFVNNDATVPNAPCALAMIELPDWGGAPTALSTVGLWGVLPNTDGTDDDTDAPSGSASNGARFFGSFILAASDSLQRRTISISLDGIMDSMEVNFYIQNNSGQNLNNDGGTSCVLKITPYSYEVA
jgi:hypothetical protein